MTRWLIIAALLVSAPLAHGQLLNPAPPVPQDGPEINDLDRKLVEVEEVEPLLELAARFRRENDPDSAGRVFRRLAQIRPHIGGYKYEMAAAYGQMDLKTFTYNALLQLQSQGYAFKVEDDPRFEPVSTTPVWGHIVKAFATNREPFGQGSVLATLPREDLLIESLAWDPGRKRVLVGGARDGAVYTVEGGGALKPLIRANKENGMWAVLDLVVDSKRGFLWVASTAVPHYKAYNAETDLGRAGVFKFDLKTGKFLKRFLSPTAVGQSFFMSSLALGPDGAVYAADGVNNAVYVISDDQLKRLFHAPVLTSIRGMTVSGNGEFLYFADHERGLFGYDLKNQVPFELAIPPQLALGGIDGIVWWRNQLAIVQGAMAPRRIMRLKLSEDGGTVVGVQPLEANKDELSLPTMAALDGDRLLVIGNSQKLNYDRFGLPRDASKLEGTIIYALDLMFGEIPAAKPD